MLKLLVFLILLFSFVEPEVATIIFIVLLVLFEGWLLLMNALSNPKLNVPLWTIYEKEAVKKYPLFFRYPIASKSFSSTLSGIVLSTFIWVPWLLYNRLNANGVGPS